MSEEAPLKRLLSIFRKDGGLGSDAERVAQLAWMLFLRTVDEQETEREIVDERYRSPIPERLRWRNWTADLHKFPGDSLLTFVNRELFPGLRDLPASKDGLTTLVREFARTASNFMRSGALLADAIRHLNAIDFQHLSAKKALANDFEQQLGDMARGEEFFTPAALARLTVDLLDPELGEMILDPDFGSGAFLIAAVDRLRDRWVRLPEHEDDLARSLHGTEQTALGWLVTCTQLMLRDVVPTSRVAHANPLARPLAEIGPADRADVIAGTVPFAGRTEPALLDGFPPAFRTPDPTLLYLVLSMQLLRSGGRAALIVPEGVMFKQGVAARVRQRLLEDCDLHTIVRLPAGTFAPYTGIKTNILFFTQGGRTREVWYYEHRVPEGLRGYSRKRPLRAEDFEPLRTWWSDRLESDVAFRVPIETLEARDFDLDVRHPRAPESAAIPESASSLPSRPPPASTPTPTPSSPAGPIASPTDAPMRVRGLQLRDFRGFSRLDIDFTDTSPAVLIGINGAGKSTVLDAIGLFLSTFAARAGGSTSKGAATTAELLESVRVGQEAATVGIVVQAGGQDRYWELRINKLKGKAVWSPELGRQAGVLRDQLLHGVTRSVPVLCWYAATRGFGESPAARHSAASFPQLLAYESAFRRGLGPFSDFLRWFRQQEDLENETRLREDPAHRSRHLDVVRGAVKRFMSELGSGHFSDLRIERAAGGASGEGALILEKNGIPLRIEQLSDGEKGTILLVSDLARRFALAHGHSEDPLQGDGIVLIDEIDRDLHPKWQRAFLPALTATFPGCQILATTHSPQVLSGVRKENVFVLEDFTLARAPYTYGRDANSILSEVMYLSERPGEIEKQIRDVGVLMDTERFDAARTALNDLAAVIGEQDSEVVRLKTLMAFLEG
jgi:type I restriction enzyme M protein